MYLEVFIPSSVDQTELLIAELSMIDFDSFQELDSGLQAYVDQPIFDKDALLEILSRYQISETEIVIKEMENINWNEEWEKNFDPVTIGDLVHVRATFHPDKSEFPYQIIINPRMSFGTGHHETTSLMLAAMTEIEMKGHNILDAGTGTGILAIMACMKGANKVDATDIDEWSIDNCVENFELNGMQKIKMHQGTIDELTFEHTFDGILANINKNVLLHDIKYYAQLLKKGGWLMLSGFYMHDVDDIAAECGKYGMQLQNTLSQNNWACVRFAKP